MRKAAYSIRHLPAGRCSHELPLSRSGHAAVDTEFLECVSRALTHAGAILIVGPGGARTELHKHLQHVHPQVAAKISAVEAIDHPSDGELLAHARRFFKADDRMRSQIHG